MNPAEMDTRRREFFNDHAENWLDMFYRNKETGELDRFREEFTRLFDLARLEDGDTVLDLGCGCGVLAPHILERIGSGGSLYEVDYSEKMIAVNKELHDDQRITFLNESADQMSVRDGAADAVICFSCFPHFQDKTATLTKIHSTLREGGSLTIAHFDSSEDINDRHMKHECVMHDHLPSEDEMRTLLKETGFDVETFIDEDGFYCIRCTAV